MPTLSNSINDLRTYAWFERGLAGICLITPLVLILIDKRVRGSISAYYNMSEHQWFYFLLTAAVMLFAVNGFVWKQHGYNIVLAIALALIVLFNHQEAVCLHRIGVGVFFVGNGLVIAAFSRGPGFLVKSVLLLVMVLVGLALWRRWFPWFTVFWAEWLSMAAIAVHFVLDSFDQEFYQAMERGQPPSLTA